MVIKKNVFLILVLFAGFGITAHSQISIHDLTQKSNAVTHPDEIRLRNAEPDFTSFIKKFSTDKSYQLAHIKFPVGYLKIQKKDWKFIEKDEIFEGKSPDYDPDDYPIEGFFGTTENGYFYLCGQRESDWIILRLDFEKINTEWMLVEYRDGSWMDDE